MAGDKAGICRFGAERLQIRINAFVREVEGVRAGTDPESVHRMRVASRRLRSTLPLFSSCFPDRKFRRWVKDLRVITRALGKARDTDVQLLFLDQYERDGLSGSGDRSGIMRIRTCLTELRKAEQDTILSALASLEERGTLQELSAAVHNVITNDHRHTGTGIKRGRQVFKMAGLRIREKLTALLAFDSVVHDPLDVQGHHAMRIAAKRLRYTLEVFRPLYKSRLKPIIASLKHLQEILGELHDCDVWIQQLSGETGRTETGTAPCGDPIAESGDGKPADAAISLLLLNRRQQRDALYQRLVTGWKNCSSGSVWERLRTIISTVPGQEPGDGLSTTRKDTTKSGEELLGQLGAIHPEGHGHARQVTYLALMLFDELSALHRFGKKERLLLWYAGRLHDIGWAHGQKGHHTRSFRMIAADRTLPVTGRERAIIALLARYHRKAFPERPEKMFPDLKRKDRERVLMLSALLRIADGLDYTHGNRVESLSCTIAPDAVTCVPVYDGDGGIERARALQKSDLFEQVFLRRFAIP